MFKISEIYDNNKSDRFEIEKRENSYDLKLNGETLKEGYENIFIYGDNLFVLVAGGKFGAVQYNEELNEVFSLSCEYITLDEYWHNLLFSKLDELVYYAEASKMWIKLIDASSDGKFLYAEDEKTYLIIDYSDGSVIWQEDKSNKHFIDKPCFVFCGKVNENPIFYDITHAEYITKTSDGYVRHKSLPSLQKPIIVNGVNVVNICYENGKIGTIDEKNKKIIKPRWDEIKVELKVTYQGGDEQREETFDIADIKADDVIPTEEW